MKNATTEIDGLVAGYIEEHPAYRYPRNGMTHPAILAITGEIKPWLMRVLGGPLPYWQAMLDSARIWFKPGDKTEEFRLFRLLFEGEGNSFWNGDPELEALAREYNDWIRGMKRGT